MASVRARTLVKAPRRMARRLRIENQVSLAIGELDEAPQQARRLAELGAEAATQREVVGEGRGEGAHRAPPAVGQGRATPRRASKSRLA